MFSTVTKMMLKNVIRHTDTHNKIVEETDMWKLYEKKKSREHDPRQSFLYDDRYDMSRDSVYRGSRHAHMDDREDRNNGTRQSTYWQRQLQKAEEADPDRWGHNGFKELYPETFRSDRSEDSDDSTERRKKRKNKKEKKRKSKDGKEKRKSSKRQSFSSESSEDSQIDGIKHRHTPSSRKFSRKSDHYKNEDVSFSSNSTSDSDSNSRKRKYKSEFKTEPKTVESDISLVKKQKLEVEDFQWIEKTSNAGSRDLHSRNRSEKDFRTGMKESDARLNRNKMDRYSRDRRDGDDEERKNRNHHGHDKISEKKGKSKSLDDSNESSKRKKRTSSDDSQGSVRSFQDNGVDKTRRMKHKKHKNKHKSKKKKRKNAETESDESSESDSERRYRKR